MMALLPGNSGCAAQRQAAQSGVRKRTTSAPLRNATLRKPSHQQACLALSIMPTKICATWDCIYNVGRLSMCWVDEGGTAAAAAMQGFSNPRRG